eukprot:TRINITY_DN25358_c0_g1_i1.p1 TRINITY_DN25358_c0_g1~~TRINITY_DN25358_c0_g1_i1.p1  ORF type:complete len:398 (+),score=75.78 TRINITY_DN25358_c0_g1_i1:55-1194(+)
MNVCIEFPEAGFTGVVLTIQPETTVRDLLRDVATEWLVNEEDIEVSYEGEMMAPITNEVASFGVECNSELMVSKKELVFYSKNEWLKEGRAAEIAKLFSKDPSRVFTVDADTFSDQDNNLVIGIEYLPPSLRKISFFNTSPVTSFGRCFLAFQQLTSCDLTGFDNVVTVGDYFLHSMPCIVSLDISPLKNVTSIGDSFLDCCTSLTGVDLTQLVKVRMVGNDFLSRVACSRVDLSTFVGVTEIGSHFLSCSSITDINLSGLCNVTVIGNGFLHGCSSLTAVDLSGLQQLSSIGDSFLSGCTSLSHVDLSGISRVTRVGDCFLRESAAIINLPALSSLTSVGRFFLLGSTSIDPYDIAQFSRSLTERRERAGRAALPDDS